MKFERRLRKHTNVNLTPLIDVVLLLLIFFMISTTFSRDNSLQINLPEANGETAPDASLRIEILVAQDGSYAVNGNALANTRLDTLMEAVTALAAGDLSVPVTIIADAETTHQAVVTAMDAVARLGFTGLTIATRQPEAQ